MTPVLGLASAEFRISRRNRWIAIAVGLMAVFALALSLAGSAPTGALGADPLSVTVASLTSLAVYLVPLMALLMSFDAIAGEGERGTLSLLLTYPTGRGTILAGKFLAHLTVLSIALVTGYGVAAVVGFLADSGSVAGLPALIRLTWTSLLLGATFLAIGYVISAAARRPGTAAGLAIGVWLVAVVLFDLMLLAAIVADDGGTFTSQVFPWLLIANPADAFRLFNLAASEATSAAVGLSGAANALPPMLALSSLILWPVVALCAAIISFRRVTP